ncbi:entericidin [Neisseria sp. 20925_1_37]
MKKFALIALATITLLSACNTISGVAKDVSAAGTAVSNTAENVKTY